mmetsp:Transcript_42550/g.124631  ORF Transcript_42550/g.124631 Transcript_42550/m.124631 type:complete len:438 (-) Transcript_42550:1648-2961(-)
MSFQSLISGVERPFSLCSVREKHVSCDQTDTSWMASRIATSPTARAESVLNSSACSMSAGAHSRKCCRHSLSMVIFSSLSLWKSERQCSGWKTSPRTCLSTGATSRKRASSALRCSATAPGGHATDFSSHVLMKSSKTHSRWRKEIQSSSASLRSSPVYSSKMAHDDTYDSMSARTSSRPVSGGGVRPKCSQSSSSFCDDVSTSWNSDCHSLTRAITCSISPGLPVSSFFGLSSNQRAENFSRRSCSSLSRPSIWPRRCCIWSSTRSLNASHVSSSSSHLDVIAASSTPCLLTPFIILLSSSSLRKPARIGSLACMIACHERLASPISSIDCGRFESFSSDSAMNSVISLVRAAATRRMPTSSVSERRCCWSSSAALNGASETVMQSTRSNEGSFSASLRLALSALNDASKWPPSVNFSSMSSSMLPWYMPSATNGR